MGSNALTRVVEQGGVECAAGASEGGMIRFGDLERVLARAAMALVNAWNVPPGMTLEELYTEWLDAVSGQLDHDTLKLYRLHFAAHLGPHFQVPDAISKAGIAEYGRARLRVVRRATVQKERSTLRGFLAWCHEQGYLREQLEFPVLPRRATGTAFAVRRRGKATDITPEECEALIAALPQWTRPRTDQPSFPVRARFVVAYETALRPATLDALSVPEHYSRGSETLRIPDEDDKARFGREVPLSLAAREALDTICHPGHTGLIFGDHDYRYSLEKAARSVLPATRARTFCAYDLRHARLTQLAETGNLPGVAYIAGHKRVTTTSIYVKPGLRAAKLVLGGGGAEQGAARTPRNVLDLSAAALRALEPPTNEGQALAEWQALVNALADARTTAEETLIKRERQRRASPRDPVALDDLVAAAIGSGSFSAQLALRARVGCSLSRLRASLQRLQGAGRVTKVTSPAGAEVWVARR